MKSFDQRLQLGVLVGAAMCTACFSIEATDGRVFSGRSGAMVEAVQTSAAHDLGCAADAIGVRDVSAADSDSTWEFVIDGCGWHATYQVQGVTGINHFKVVKVLAVPPSAMAPAHGTSPVSISPPRPIPPVVRSSSGSDWLVSCPERAADCSVAAALTCPAGYLVLDDEGRAVAAALSGMPAAVSGGQLRGRCIASVMREDPVLPVQSGVRRP